MQWEAMLRGRARELCRALHVWIGLSLGALFILLGLTGSLIAWLPELDQALNPALLRAGSSASQPELDTASQVQAAVERLTRDPAYGRPRQIFLPLQEDGVLIAWYTQVKPAGDAPFGLTRSRQVMLDPATLQIKGERKWGAIGLSTELLAPTLFHLHNYLLAGEAGKTVLGIAALLMLILSVCGLALWWPRASWSDLKRALAVSYRGSWPRLQFSLHRTVGFSVAPLLMMLAVSGMYFTFPTLLVPLVAGVLPMAPREKPANQASDKARLINPAQAVRIAQALYPAARVTRVALPADRLQPYEVRLRQPNERQDSGATRITVDAFSGKVLKMADPFQAKTGDAFLGWLFPLHSGQALGATGKAAISLLGCAPLLLGITGWLVWRRRGRKCTNGRLG